MKRRSFLKSLIGIAGLSAAGGIGSVQKPVIGFDPAKPDSDRTEVLIGHYEGVSFIKTDDVGNIVEKETFGQSIPADPRIISSQKQLNAFYRKFIDNANS